MQIQEIIVIFTNSCLQKLLADYKRQKLHEPGLFPDMFAHFSQKITAHIRNMKTERPSDLH